MGTLLLAALLAATPVGGKSARDTAHFFEAEYVLDSSQCSGTAIGPHALLTVSHCEIPTDEATVDGHYVKIVRILRDGHDHSIFLLSGVTFPVVATLGEDKLYEGEHIHFWGHLDGKTRALYREGTVALLDEFEPDSELKPATVPHTLIQVPTGGGDSGSGIFNADEQLIGVLSMSEELGKVKFAGMFNLDFTSVQLDEARKF